jgi:hypothetical protein
MSETDTEAKWVGRVRAWRESGASAGSFAEGQGFAASTLRWWDGKLTRASKSKLHVAMARVVRTPPGKAAEGDGAGARVRAGPTASALAIDVDGVQIAVRRGFDAELLRQVVRALGGER